MNISTRRTVQSRLPIIGVASGLMVSGVLSLASFSKIGEFQHHAAWVDHTHQVRFELQQTVFVVSDAQAAVRGFSISGKPEFLASYQNAQQRLPALIAGLAAQIADNPDQVRSMGLLKSAVERYMGLMAHTIALQRDSGTAESAQAYITAGWGQAALEQVRSLVSEMQAREDKLLTQRQQYIDAGARDTRLLLVAGTVFVFLAFGVAYWLLSRAMQQRLRAEQALIAAHTELVSHTGQLELANKELEGFSYSVSHDLRIPLRAVAGYASMLAEDHAQHLDAEGGRLLNVILENSKRMGLLIDDLLAFSRLGRQALSATAIEMRALVDIVVTEVQDRDHAQNAHVVLEDLPVAWGDRALLRQVWLNLISNALKYSGKNAQAEIRISGTRDETECVYAVHDNGVGFDMQYYRKLFGVFQRLHSAEEFPGTGVGLAIVHRIVQRHGGRVWAESLLNQGATFYFSLPHQDES